VTVSSVVPADVTASSEPRLLTQSGSALTVEALRSCREGRLALDHSLPGWLRRTDRRRRVSC